MGSAAVAGRLGHTFREPALLEQALTHRSFGAAHNERLEFLGDGVLNCVIASELYRRFPELPEGDLSRLRAHLVNQAALAEIAGGLDIGSSLRLGDGEARSGGRERPSIFADALEAIIGAYYLDSGFAAARRFVLRLLVPEIDKVREDRHAKDYKTPVIFSRMRHAHSRNACGARLASTSRL